MSSFAPTLKNPPIFAPVSKREAIINMVTQKPPKVVGRIVLALLLVLAGFLFRMAPFGTFGFGEGRASDNLLEVKNETLGFQKVIVLGLPERTDKKDGVSLASSLSGFKIEWEYGVRGESVPEKAMPMNWEKMTSPDAIHHLGCWRSHMNILQRMVHEGIQSALIIEDDADWDVMLKSQLVEFARGSRYILGSPAPTHSPYGDNWDILWFGHCGAINRMKEDHKAYVIQNDPTVIPVHLRIFPSRRPNMTPPALHGNNTRVIFSPQRALCTASYAISLRGAQKLLYDQAMTDRGVVIDRGISNLCSKDSQALCIAPYPAMFGSFRAPGNASRDSDIADKASKVRKVGNTEMIAHPVRLNLDRFLAGERSFKSQWPKDTLMPEVELAMELPRGRQEYLTKDQFLDVY